MLTEQLHDRLKAVADSAERLSTEAQNKLAEEIAHALENVLWDVQLCDPDHLSILRELAEEARLSPKLPMPTPRDTGDEGFVDAATLHVVDDESAR